MRVRRRVSQVWLAMHVGTWLCALPFRWRGRSLPAILGRIGLARRPIRISASEIASTIRVVQRVSRLRVFSLPIFPRHCLREALALYHVLGDAGHPVRFCVGVSGTAERLLAHSWVTLHGRPVLPVDRNGRFRVLYSYPERQTDATAQNRREPTISSL
jgi:hypothetical protein